METFEKNEKCKNEMENWQIKISKNPHQVTGHVMSPGNLVMGKQNNGNRVEFNLDGCQDIDRKIQA